MSAPPRPASPLPTLLAHAAVAIWMFSGPLFEGRVLFFRDISIYYYPNYVFVERALRSGIWPLWNHASDLGAPFLLADPLDLLLLAGPGAAWALRVLPSLYVWIGMAGATLLARRLGRSVVAAWAVGLFYGTSGVVLSSVNLFEYFHAVGWAPLVIAAFLALWDSPVARRIAAFAALAALLTATLSLEMALQTAVFGLALIPRRPDTRRVAATLAAGGLAALLAAPVLLGVATLLSGSARASGFSPDVSFAWSAAPMVLLEAVVPRLFGDTHTWGELGFWGQPFFATDLPYLLSLYLGPIVLGLALLAGRGGGRLWALAAASVLLAMGDRGPLGALMAPWMGSMRVPVKFIWTASLALCLLAGHGLDRLRSGPSRRLGLGLLIAGASLGAVSLACAARPEAVRELLSRGIPELGHARAAPVVAAQWPPAFAITGILAGAAGAVALLGRALAPLVAVLAGLDLLVSNERINTTAPAGFYQLRPALAAAVEDARAEGAYRWFSYGLAHSPGITASPEIAALNSDVWLYYLERQALLPRTPVLDGLESAFDLDRVGWSPPGSTLGVDEKDARRFPEHHALLRLANVRWVLSFHPLPAELVEERAAVPVPEVQAALLLYELRAALPRAFWVPRAEQVADPVPLRRRRDAGGRDPLASVLLEEPVPAAADPEGRAGEVRYERLDPHRVRLQLSGGPGWVVVLDNHHSYWHAEGPEGPEPLYRAYGGFQALATPGGTREVMLRYRPPWLAPSLAGSCAAALICLGLALVPGGRGRSGTAETRVPESL